MTLPDTENRLNVSTLKLFGFLAMFSAVTTIPFLLFSLTMSGRKDIEAGISHLFLLVASVIIFTAVSIALCSFLKRNHGFTGVHLIIAAMILLNIVYSFVSGAALVNPGLAAQISSIEIGLVILLGIIQIGFGLRLFTLQANLGGMKRPYCFINIATGICLCSIVLVPIGIIFGAVADVMLATIFFHEAKQLDRSTPL